MIQAMWGNHTLFHWGKSIENKTLREEKYGLTQLQKTFLIDPRTTDNAL